MNLTVLLFFFSLLSFYISLSLFISDITEEKNLQIYIGLDSPPQPFSLSLSFFFNVVTCYLPV